MFVDCKNTYFIQIVPTSLKNSPVFFARCIQIVIRIGLFAAKGVPSFFPSGIQLVEDFSHLLNLGLFNLFNQFKVVEIGAKAQNAKMQHLKVVTIRGFTDFRLDG